MSTPALVEHFFRHEYGKLVATLTRRFGVVHLSDIEDAVQSALMSALTHWPATGVPDKPSAWLFRAAQNQLLSALRTQSRRHRLAAQHVAEDTAITASTDAWLSHDVQDDMLRMVLLCCDDTIPVASQLVFTLKTVCGLTVGEIAARLFTTEANVYKRLTRARNSLRTSSTIQNLTPTQCAARIPATQQVFYLLFTEGYLSVHAETALRRDLCAEALRLTQMLAEHPLGQTPSTYALLALMHLHIARMDARDDGRGGLLLLEEQDRSRWDQQHIRQGLAWLGQSASGDVFSRYHAEAGIAAEHCLAPSFEHTRWDRIAESYALLTADTTSAIHTLNHAVAVAEWQGPQAGLEILQDTPVPSWLSASYMWSAVMADLHRRCGHHDDATHYRNAALSSAPTTQLKALLQRRLG